MYNFDSIKKNDVTKKVIMPDGHTEAYEDALEWDWD